MTNEIDQLNVSIGLVPEPEPKEPAATAEVSQEPATAESQSEPSGEPTESKGEPEEGDPHANVILRKPMKPEDLVRCPNCRYADQEAFKICPACGSDFKKATEQAEAAKKANGPDGLFAYGNTVTERALTPEQKELREAHEAEQKAAEQEREQERVAAEQEPPQVK